MICTKSLCNLQQSLLLSALSSLILSLPPLYVSTFLDHFAPSISWNDQIVLLITCYFLSRLFQLHAEVNFSRVSKLCWNSLNKARWCILSLSLSRIWSCCDSLIHFTLNSIRFILVYFFIWVLFGLNTVFNLTRKSDFEVMCV